MRNKNETIIMSFFLHYYSFKNRHFYIDICSCNKKPLEIQMKKQKKSYVKVEMLIVSEKYQGQGYMRKLMEFAYKMADKNGCPCILDTDAKGKCDRYVHLGMELVQTRTAAGCKIYDLMYRPKGVN